MKINKKELLTYLINFFLCLVFLFSVFKLWQADLSIPFQYEGDSVYIGTMIKGLIENHTIWQNPLLGAPVGLQTYDFPISDNALPLILIKIIIHFTQNFAVVENLFYLLTFPLISLISTFVLRQMKISRLNSVIFALVYTFLPYHLLRGINHLFLSAYFCVPLATLLCYYLYTEQLEFKKEKLLNNKKIILISFLSCLIIGSNGMYYTFFSCLFLILTGLILLFRRSKLPGLLASLFCIGLITLVFIINLFPMIAYQKGVGGNQTATGRSPNDSEVFSLKISRLILPIDNHQITFLKNIKNTYSNEYLTGEGWSESLGILGAIGFILLLFNLIFKTYKKENYLSDMLTSFNISALLFATIGGLGSLFAYFISPQIRSQGRLSIFIGWFSLTFLALLLDHLFFPENNEQTKMQNRKFVLPILGTLIILLIFCLDTTPPAFVNNYQNLKNKFLDDQKFVNQIMEVVKEKNIIYQLPFIQFPGQQITLAMPETDLFRGYLHSAKLSWSYGIMKGRNDSYTNWFISKQLPEQMVKYLKRLNYGGIYIERSGFNDNANQLVTNFKNILGETPINNSDGNLIFFSLKTN